MINPQKLDLKSLPWLPLEEKSSFPRKSAIYFAIDSTEKVQYIGRSNNVYQRWINHHKYNHLANIGNIKISYLFIDNLELLPEIETALIEWYQPPLNKVYSRSDLTQKTSIQIKLKELRENRGISQNELARQLEMSLANVQRIEYNKIKSIPFTTLEALCKILKCQIGELLVLTEDVFNELESEKS